MPKKFKFYFLKLTLIITAVFIFQLIIPGFTELFVLNQKALYEHQYWRFITAIFLHGSVVHLVYNLFALLFFGIALEKLISSRRFLTVFLASGIIANIIAINFYGSSLGASGAIYGVLGALTIIKPFMMIWAFGLIMPIFIAAILWIVADGLRSLGMFGPTNIGSIAHLSGIGVGFILGFIFYSLKNKKTNYIIQIPEHYMESWESNYMR